MTKWNSIYKIPRPLLTQSKCSINVSSRSSQPWGRLVFVVLLSIASIVRKPQQGHRTLPLLTSSPTQNAPCVHPHSFFSLTLILVWLLNLLYPSGYLSSHLLPTLLLQRMAGGSDGHNTLASEWGISVGLGVRHSVLEVRGSFHSKHRNSEGIEVWVCGRGGEEKMFHYFSIS